MAVHPVISILLKNAVVFIFFVAWHGNMPFSKEESSEVKKIRELLILIEK